MSRRRMIPIVVIIITIFCSTTVYANSSWYWISTTRPYDVLPYVAAITLVAETLAVNYICHIRRPVKVFLVMLLGNLVSFCIPYIGALLDPVFHIPGHPWQSVLMYAESLPFYTVGAFYLLLTIIQPYILFTAACRYSLLTSAKFSFSTASESFGSIGILPSTGISSSDAISSIWLSPNTEIFFPQSGQAR